MSNPTELVQRLREHDDERLYQEADVLMSEAANEIERLQVCAATLQKIATVNAMDYEYQNWARQALATLSPLCGAQHAESGKEAIYQVATDKGFAWADVGREVYDQYAGSEYRRRIVYAAQQAAAPDGNWLWSKLMDWCKNRGVAPANFDDLFAIVGEARGAPGTPEAPDEPVAWMNPHETFAPDAFLWQQDPGHPLYSVPVYKRAAQLDGGQEGSESNG